MSNYLHWIRIGMLALMLPLFGEGSVPLNTSNPYKLAEYRDLFSGHGLSVSSTHYDLHEIDADPISVVVHKASQMEEGILVDDTSLEVEGREIGVKIRWLQHLLSSCVGKRACWRVLLAKREGDLVYVYEGRIDGEIVKPRGRGGYSFDAYLLPDGSKKTLAEEHSQEVSARARAVHNLINGEPTAIVPVINDWDGAWQHEVQFELVAG